MTSFSTTFNTSDKRPEPVRKNDRQNSSSHMAMNLQQYRRYNCTQILQGSSFESDNTEISSNSFVKTVIDCYNRHHNLVLRPDDIWSAILVQFSFYVNANAEEFRGKFVNFEGKKELVVIIPGTLTTAPYNLFVRLMTEEIHKNLVDDEIRDWILPNFTTTTKDDYVTAGVVFMATMKKYFEYSCCLMCGIPNITLEGTIEDWEKVYGRLQKLKTYKLDKWVEMLEPILTEFIKAKSGEVDLNFWQRICHYHAGGSGPSYLSGWITAFCVFDVDGKWQGDGKPQIMLMRMNTNKNDEDRDAAWPWIETGNVPTGIVDVDVKIQDNGTEYKSVMFAGHMARQILEDDCTLQPRTGWVMALKSDEKNDAGGDGDGTECFENDEDY